MLAVYHIVLHVWVLHIVICFIHAMNTQEMQATQENVDAVSHYLNLTLSPDKTQRRQAEAYLTSVESTEGYGPLLLSLLQLVYIDLFV